MDILSMVYFTTVCNFKNITKAAESLHISQPALSRRIFAMEEELEVELLDRKRGGFNLTPAGKIFLEEAERIVSEQNRLLKRIDKYKHKDSICIGYSANMYLRPLIELIGDFKKEYVEKELRFQEARIEKQVSALLSDDVDIIYTTKGDVDGISEVEYITIAENDIMLLVPKGHKLWRKSSVQFKDLVGEKVCVVNEAKQISLTASKSFDGLKQLGAPVESFKDVLYCRSSFDMILYVCAYECLGIGGALMTSEVENYPERLKRVRLDYDHIDFGDLVFAYKKDNVLVRELVEFLKSK